MTTANVTGSVAVTPKSSDCSVRVMAKDPASPIAMPIRMVRNPWPRIIVTTSRGAGAQGHSHADLARASADRIRHYAKDADCCQQQRQHGEAANENRIKPA